MLQELLDVHLELWAEVLEEFLVQVGEELGMLHQCPGVPWELLEEELEERWVQLAVELETFSEEDEGLAKQQQDVVAHYGIEEDS